MQAFTLEAVRELSARWIWPALLHSVWIGVLAASTAALLFQSRARLCHRARHGVLLGALALVLVGPVVATGLQRAIAKGSPAAQHVTWEITVGAKLGEAVASHRAVGGAIGGEGIVPERPTRSMVVNDCLASVVGVVTAGRRFILTVWVLCVALIAAYFSLGAGILRRVCREAEPAAQPIQRRVRTLARCLRLGRVPRVLVHTRVEEPFLCGILRPVIVLPARFVAVARGDAVDAILAHELAHFRRLDHVVNLAQRFAEMLLFFHPAVHWLSRSLRRQREFCADAAAARLTGDAFALADALERVAVLRRACRYTPVGISSTGGETSSLLPRIQELLGMKPVCTRTRTWPFFALPATGLLAFLAVSAGVADDKPGRATAAVTDAPAAPPLDNSEAARAPLPLQVAYGSQPVDSAKTIEYEVRILSGDAHRWRPLLDDRPNLAKKDGECTAWVIDGRTLNAWLAHAQRDVHFHLLQAPTVRTYDGAQASISGQQLARKRAHLPSPISTKVTDLEPEPDGAPRIQSAKPIVEQIPVGPVVSMTGKILSGKIRLTVDVRDLRLTTEASGEKNGPARDRNVPAIIERRSTVACDVPTGRYVAICMGLRPETVTAHAASGPLSGVPPRDATYPDSEVGSGDRLVVFLIGAREAADAAGVGVGREYLPISTRIEEGDSGAKPQK